MTYATALPVMPIQLKQIDQPLPIPFDLADGKPPRHLEVAFAALAARQGESGSS